MAKRRTKMASQRAANRLARSMDQLKPSGNSNYGLKHKEQRRGHFRPTSPFRPVSA